MVSYIVLIVSNQSEDANESFDASCGTRAVRRHPGGDGLSVPWDAAEPGAL